MKHLELIRTSNSHLCTMGVLQEDGIPFLATLENPWRFNKPSISCIPEGTYLVEPFDSEKHHNSYIVRDVEGRSGILFHSGNVEAHTEGCILPGLGFGVVNNQPAVVNSRNAMKLLETRVGRDSFLLTVRKG